MLFFIVIHFIASSEFTCSPKCNKRAVDKKLWITDVNDVRADFRILIETENQIFRL